MQELIDKMRADWSVVAAHRVAAKEWTKEDEIEIGQAITAAIDAKDRNAVEIGNSAGRNGQPGKAAVGGERQLDDHKILTRSGGFALGLLYDLLGRPQQALDILTNTLNSVKGRPEEEGREVLLFFIGRENLLLQRPTDAEAAFNQARDVNPDYARAYIGLGGVAFQRAQAQTPEERLTTSTWLDQSLANYQTALDKAQITRDTQVIAKARLGLGYAHRLRGEAYLRQNFGDADKEFAQAIDLIRGVLPELSGQYRLLGQGFSALGAAYEEAAFSRQAQNDKAGARDLYQKAQDAYG
ncbi:MAG TPA: hypothetical protein PKK51_10150, partial [Rhodocyclaceae bacterium]|nr:hypothetical protein [Rhodocyclaceae bacterium]